MRRPTWSLTSVDYRPTFIFGLRNWPLVLGVPQMVDIGIVVPEIDIFASSTGEFNIITLDHMKKLKNVLSLETPDTFDNDRLG